MYVVACVSEARDSEEIEEWNIVHVALRITKVFYRVYVRDVGRTARRKNDVDHSTHSLLEVVGFRSARLRNGARFNSYQAKYAADDALECSDE